MLFAITLGLTWTQFTKYLPYASIDVLIYNYTDDAFVVGFEDTGSEKCSPSKSGYYTQESLSHNPSLGFSKSLVLHYLIRA